MQFISNRILKKKWFIVEFIDTRYQFGFYLSYRVLGLHNIPYFIYPNVSHHNPITHVSEKDKITIDPMELIRGKKIVGTWGGETNPDEDIPKYVDWYQSGTLELDKMITHEYTLMNINEAFDDLENGKVGRAIINTFD